MLEFSAGIFRGEVPVGFGVMGIAVVLPGGDFLDEGVLVGNAAVEALGGEDTEFGFRQIEPTAVLGRVMHDVGVARVRQEGLVPLADQIIGRWFTPSFFADHADRVAAIRALLTATDPEGYASTCEALAAMDLRDQLGKITAPTLVIAGAEDQSTPLAQAREIADGIRGARLVVVDRAAHMANIEQPDAISQAVLTGLG